MKYYTIGEVFRLGLLKNHKGEPYKHKATVSKIISHMDTVKKETAWGLSVTISDDQISRHNRK